MSLLQYLSQRLLLLGIVLSAGLFYIVYILYQWGLDDSTEYYLQQDMQWAVEILANKQELPKNTQFRQFYLSASADQSLLSNVLPKKFPKLLASNEDTEFFFIEDDEHFQYGLHQVLADGRILTVIHQFTTEGTAEGLSLLEISIAASLMLIAIMLLGAWFIYQRISLSMQHLLMAAQVKDSIVTGSEFSEIENVIITLKNALEDLEEKNEQERLFIQTLSHELRTPMATVQVALELLAKKELNANVREKIEIIFNSNQQMQHLSHDLLSLWSNTPEDQTNESNESIHLEEEIHQVINDLDKAFHCQQRFIINLERDHTETMNLVASKVYLQLLLNNLCKNAIVHSDGNICISIENSQVLITNDKSQNEIDPLVAGSGIGLIIATRAAELLGWSIEIQETDIKYELRLLFNY